MRVDIHFPVHNRLRYVEASFATLIENTDWDMVDALYITDDDSTDGTHEYLVNAMCELDVATMMITDRFGGPVAAMNTVLDKTDAEIIAKVDSDLILPPGWLQTMLRVMDEHPELDALGTEPGFAARLHLDFVSRGYLNAPHIGGQGLFRTRAFRRGRPQQKDTFFGMTQFMRRHMTCAWIDPDIAAFNLDHLPFEPWQSLARAYVAKGWSRAWSSYPRSWGNYWEWFAPDWALLAV